MYSWALSSIGLAKQYCAKAVANPDATTPYCSTDVVCCQSFNAWTAYAGTSGAGTAYAGMVHPATANGIAGTAYAASAAKFSRSK